ncbi:MAG: phosphomannomutase/phosphoglucomutase [bacterium]
MVESIFKAYDIRGVYPDELDEQTAYDIGRAYATLIQNENQGRELTIAVGEDMRLSTPALKSKLIAGLIDSGVNVVEIGLVTTPTFYFAVGFHKYDGGMMVSASHNPKDHNGFKMVRARGVPVSGEAGIEDIKQMVIKQSFITAEKKGQVAHQADVLTEAVQEEIKGIALEKIKPFKIVVDAANAMGALDVEAMFKDLPCEIIKLNFELDGNFPSHQPDPIVAENRELTRQEVIKHKADLGIVPDGDGDRYFFIDEQGNNIPQGILRGIMAQIALKENPGATVCYDIRPGKITQDMIEAVNGHGIVTRVGHSLIKETMLKEKAVFGGESSGHYFYKFPFGTFEAPITLVMKFLVYLSEQDKPASEVVKPYDIYFHSGEINSKVDDVQGKLKLIKETFSDGKINELDGITVEYPDWWCNIRPSNTEPLLRLALEARSQEIMEQKRDEILALIKQ